jgi:hypothetical protein
MRVCFQMQLILLPLLVTVIAILPAHAQVCPTNIDFESGTFNGWTCYTGTTLVAGGENEISLQNSNGPVYNRHTMYSRTNGVEYDEYGGFPKICPNGSGYSVRLGNNLAGTEAEGLSYEFTIPADRDIYSLVYHYAVVFQDPDHEIYQQARLVLEITNLTDNKMIDCSSFTFIPYGTVLPGFYESPNPGGNTPVWCKDWSAVSINLNGNAGKRIRLMFKTADCTFRRHFGYAYLDVNSECTSEFTGAVYCDDDTAMNLTAPYGYQAYTWWDSTFNNVLGHEQTIRFAPAPPSGSTFAVQVIPYHGYGCLDTFYAKVIDTLTYTVTAGPDKLSCNEDPVLIGQPPKQGFVYNWSPVDGLSDPTAPNPYAFPSVTTKYVVTCTHDGGGCLTRDTVEVRASIIDNSLQLLGKPIFCSDSGDSAKLLVHPTNRIQWYKDERTLLGATLPQYRVLQSGTYYAMLYNSDGCTASTERQVITIDDPRPGITYPTQFALAGVSLDLKARQFGDYVAWSPGTSLSAFNTFTPVFKGNTEQLYTIRIGKTGGCVTVDTQMVKIVKSVEIFVPNAFTPGSVKNNQLRPLLRGVKQLNYFRVYNRWGNLVYETNAALQGWNGMFNGIQQPSQTVVWVLEGIGLDGVIYRKKGVSVLIR